MDEGLVTPLLGVKKVWNGYDPLVVEISSLFYFLTLPYAFNNMKCEKRRSEDEEVDSIFQTF